MAASWSLSSRTLLILLVAGFVNLCTGSRKLASLVETPQILLTYHNGALLNGEIPISILWYGKFTAAQKSIISDFILSLTPNTVRPLSPSVSQWWTTIDQFYVGEKTQILLAGQVSDESCSFGKSIKRVQLTALAAKAGSKKGGIALVLTAADVAVEGFCSSSCGSHGSDRGSGSVYIWVGNSADQCPGQCAWPFHQPAYGPQAPPLTAPNGDVGVDGMVANVASMVAAAVTNPYGGGFYQGPAAAPFEAATACAGAYGRGAYPGYAGDVLVDPATGASYNANGAHERKYLLPALFDPSTSKCSTLV